MKLLMNIIEWINNIQEKYSVSPLIFGLIFVISIIPCWYSIYKVISSLKKNNKKSLFKWLIIFAFFYYSPYLYIYLFGKNLPSWFHFVFWGFILILTYTLTKKIINKSKIIEPNQRFSNWTDLFFWDLYSYPYNKLISFSLPHQRLYNRIWQILDFGKDRYILDVGCGGGHLERFIVNNKGINNINIEAVDFSSKMLEEAKKNCRNFTNIHFNQLDLDKKLPYINDSFDGIICISVLFALSSQKIFKEFSRLLKQGGKLILVEPKPDFDGKKFWQSQKRGLRLRDLKLRAVVIYPLIPLIILLNKIIEYKQKKGRYQQFSLYRLKESLAKEGFKVENIESVLADQDWFILSTKGVSSS